MDETGAGARIIPAYAGSTTPRNPGPAPTRDHPRIRGEHQVAGKAFFEDEGSSPHTRGAHRPARSRGHHKRIIPAYAGSTGWTSLGRRRCKDHPRIRGEHNPRHAADECDAGIIPAYAGSTLRIDSRDSGCRDHPRIRGEHLLYYDTDSVILGSSPHTRGAQ